ncbi:Neuronal membrane glycoprotein M6-a [Trichinella spiralis]|uniref:Neuronal membrane glycoprotein M6-a n=1 Tax=Trichinella spiralis TaxID=6334 RepID=A0ABR3K4L9_TRISP
MNQHMTMITWLALIKQCTMALFESTIHLIQSETLALLLFATKQMASRQKGTYRSTNLERTPYASLIALSISVFGVISFSWITYSAVNVSLQQLRSVFYQQFHWYDKVKLVFIGLAIAMLSFLLLLTIFGLLATGSTRDVYTAAGEVELADNLCKTVSGYESENCLDFTTVGILLNSTESVQIWNTCGVTLQQFCLFTDTANGYYVISYFSTAVVLLGLVHFLICLTANYVHLSGGFKYFQLRTMPLFEGENVVDYQNERLG